MHAHLASSRVVTLVGPGGVGKTRLALRVAEVERRGYGDGWWVVPLAELVRPELLNAAVADALGLKATDGPWQIDALADYIAERTSLLVLDSCEHLLAAVGELVAGLRRTCPNVRFLLTSRRPLRLSGEDVIVVPPLSLPEETTTATPDSLTHYEAVDLFLDRARSARSDFALTADNAPVVAALCRDLDGLPLAIELAAARTPALSPQEIRQGLLEQRVVLDLGYRDADDRQQSLTACVDWSYQLCSPPEQRFWARSSVFTGGFDLSAASAVCGTDDLPPGKILDLVTGLVDQSILLAETGALGQTRYRMLNEIRQFGRERAEKDGELTAMQERHATWCADLVSRFDVEAAGSHQWEWLHRLRLEHANLGSALDQVSAAPGGAETGLVMATRLDLYWSACGLLDEARHWLELRLAAGSGSAEQRGRAMALAARFAVLQNDRPAARDLIARGAASAAGADALRARGALMVPAAMVSVWDGDPGAGADQADGAATMLRDAADLRGELLALFVAGVCHGFAGHPEEAADRHRRCIAKADEAGERHLKALAVAGLGEQELAGGRLDEATGLFRESIRLKSELDDRMGIAVGLDCLGRVAVAEGRGERAALLLGAAEEIWEVVGMSETGNPFAFAPPRSDGLQRARDLLGKKRFRDLFRRGSQLGLDEMVRFALDGGSEEPPARPARVEPSPLTRRELEVAELVADGLSNPEIAERLFISVRTAQGHVENTLRKLGFNSRAKIAAWVTERRVAEQSHAAAT